MSTFKNFNGSELLGSSKLTVKKFFELNPVVNGESCGFKTILMLDGGGISDFGNILDPNEGFDDALFEEFGSNVIIYAETDKDGNLLLQVDPYIDDASSEDDEYFRVQFEKELQSKQMTAFMKAINGDPTAMTDEFGTAGAFAALGGAKMQDTDYEFKYEHRFSMNMRPKQVFDLVKNKLGLTKVKRLVRMADSHDVEDVSDFFSESIEYAEYRVPDFNECDYMNSGRTANMYSIKVELEDDSVARFWEMQIVVDVATLGIIGVSFCNGTDEEQSIGDRDEYMVVNIEAELAKKAAKQAAQNAPADEDEPEPTLVYGFDGSDIDITPELEKKYKTRGRSDFLKIIPPTWYDHPRRETLRPNIKFDKNFRLRDFNIFLEMEKNDWYHTCIATRIDDPGKWADWKKYEEPLRLADVADALAFYGNDEYSADTFDLDPEEDFKGTVQDAADNHSIDNIWVNPDWADKPMPKTAKMVSWCNGNEPPFYCFDFIMCYDDATKEILFCVDHRD